MTLVHFVRILRAHAPFGVVLAALVTVFALEPPALELIDARLTDLAIRARSNGPSLDNLVLIRYDEEDAWKFEDVAQGLTQILPRLGSAGAVGINIAGLRWDREFAEQDSDLANVVLGIQSAPELVRAEKPGASQSVSAAGRTIGVKTRFDALQLELAVTIGGAGIGDPPEIGNAIFPPDDFIVAVGRGGFNVTKRDKDGLCRSVPPVVKYHGADFLNLGIQLARRRIGVENVPVVRDENSIVVGSRKIPLNSHGSIDLNLPPEWKPRRYSFSEFLKVSDREKIVKDRIVVISDVRPLRMIPVNTAVVVAEENGAIHGLIAAMIVDDRFLRRTDVAGQVGILLAMTVLMYLLACRLSPAPGFAMLLLGTGLYAWLAVAMLASDRLLPLLYPLSAGATGWICGACRRYVAETGKRDAIRRIFGRYLSKNILEKILTEEEKLNLGGTRQTLTILFADIRDFTTLAESLQPDDVVDYLNRYYSALVEVVFRHEGTLDKLMGDGIMIFFGDPVSQPDHARRAVACAVEMQKRMAILNQELLRQGRREISVGMGINTGDVLVGNLGSRDYIDYTVIGDVVNLASRLETNAKGGQILVTETTAALAKSGAWKFNPLEPLTVKGRTEPVLVAEVDAGH